MGSHQRIQSKYSQFPAPEDSENRDLSVTHGESPSPTVSHRESPIELELEAEPELEAEREAYASCTEPEAVSAPPVILLPLNDGTEYPVSVEQCQKWAGLYPAVDVIQQLRGMCGWLDANPQKRKTRRGIHRFVNAWLTREQDRGGQAQRPADQQRTGSSNPFLNMLEEQK